MGSDIDISLNILVIGGKEELIKRIFPIEGVKEISLPNSKEKRIFKGKGIYWEANIYETFQGDEAAEEILKYLNLNGEGKEENKPLEYKKNVLLYFYDNQSKENIEIIVDQLNEIDRPHLIYVSNKKEEFDLNDKKLIYPIIIEDEKNENEKLTKITDALWKRDCYWNERGNLIQYPFQKNELSEIQGQTFLNILIIGEARSGKSTFINKIFDSYISKELPNCSSVTKVINEYNYKDKIKFIDTPGFVKNEKMDTIPIVIDKIKQTFNNYSNSKDQIHVIYYFLSKISDLENSRKVFEYLTELKENNKNISIIFVINGDINKKGENRSSLIEGLKKFLINKENGKKDISILYEEEKKEKICSIGTKKSFKEKYKAKKNESTDIDGNIIKLNLIEKHDDHGDLKAYGIDILFKKTLDYLKSMNNLESADFKGIDDLNNFFNSYIEKKIQNQLAKEDETTYENKKKEAKELIEKISKNNSLFNKMDCVDSIIVGAGSKATITTAICSAIAAGVSFIPVPFVDFGIVCLLQASLMLSIGMIYGYNKNNIPYDSLLTSVLGGGAIDAGISSATYGAKVGGGVIAKKIVKGLGMDIAQKATLQNLEKEAVKQLTIKKIIEKIAQFIGIKAGTSTVAVSTVSQTSKYIPIVGTLIGGIIGGSINGVSTYGIGKAAKIFFESLLEINCGVSFIWANKNKFIEIFNEIDNLVKKFK